MLSLMYRVARVAAAVAGTLVASIGSLGDARVSAALTCPAASRAAEPRR